MQLYLINGGLGGLLVPVFWLVGFKCEFEFEFGLGGGAVLCLASRGVWSDEGL